MTFTLADLDRATELVHRTMGPTPAYRWPLLSEAVGADVVVKHENHLPVGAFKVRGGLVYVDRLRAERAHVRRLVSATRGNHGQSLAFAGTAAGLDVTIVVPHGNSPDKNAAMRALGADVVVHGHDFQAAREHAATLAEGDDSVEFVSSFHPDLVLGVATYAGELFAMHRDLDTVYVPVGMGSGICGLIAVRDLLGLPTEIVGVVSERADATARSFAAGHPVATDTADTFVDGVACRVPDAGAVATMLSGAARIVAVSEDATAEAMRLMLRTTHNVAEPSGAIALAGLCAERNRAAGRPVGVVLTGGNADADLLAEVLAGRTPVPA
ncbi:threonine dehydratase [Jatrophihabitans endophyticus]|uniref:threonine dehydratase n=1 Tax=Jatrophihabitans endophyticus TaxID=1206085 RepID=UPI0019EA9AE6|nr:threonine dehydratase [Jatrophihabitans endophyticus]MBE7189349.1 threonine dehydratase [Jatrophihabitans endophyticus]